MGRDGVSIGWDGRQQVATVVAQMRANACIPSNPHPPKKKINLQGVPQEVLNACASICR